MTHDEHATRPERVPLIRGRYMTCPRCRDERDILAFQRFGQIDQFERETNPIYKCPKKAGGCGWIFSPADSAVVEAVTPGLVDELIDRATEVDPA